MSAVSRLHFLSTITLMMAGVVILVLSLMAANRLSVAGTLLPSSGLKLYFGREMLPDHLFYPALMLRDRIRLETASPTEQIALKQAYAEHRYDAAVKLLGSNQEQLAITTLTKSQKYLISAGYQALEQTDRATIQQVRAAVDHSLYRLNTFTEEYQGPNQDVLSILREESRVLLQKLDERLAQ